MIVYLPLYTCDATRTCHPARHATQNHSRGIRFILVDAPAANMQNDETVGYAHIMRDVHGSRRVEHTGHRYI